MVPGQYVSMQLAKQIIEDFCYFTSELLDDPYKAQLAESNPLFVPDRSSNPQKVPEKRIQEAKAYTLSTVRISELQLN